jgi:DUF1365 family protein
MENSAIYAGAVAHNRTRPRPHHLQCRVFSLLIDIDELPHIARRLRLFSYNSWGVFSFHDCDHGGGGGELRSWVERQIEAAGLKPDGGTIWMLCYPRILGYVFNPLTIYFCHARNGALTAMLYEVSNTHSERHTYVIPVVANDKQILRQTCRKAFFVSPFIPMNCAYHFRVAPPKDTVLISIEDIDEQGVLLRAAFSGRRRPLNDANLLRVFFTYPLMTLKVTLGIHWEALRLVMKRTPIFDHKHADQSIAVSIVNPSEPREATPNR